jgi:hypothetical protein
MGGGVAEQDDRGVADPDRGAAVNPGDDLSDLVDAERASQAAWCRSVGAHEPAAHLPDSLGGDRVLDAGHAVDVSDGGAGHVEGSGCLASCCSFGQVRAQGEIRPQSLGSTGSDSKARTAKTDWCTSRSPVAARSPAN